MIMNISTQGSSDRVESALRFTETRLQLFSNQGLRRVVSTTARGHPVTPILLCNRFFFHGPRGHFAETSTGTHVCVSKMLPRSWNAKNN